MKITRNEKAQKMNDPVCMCCMCIGILIVGMIGLSFFSEFMGGGAGSFTSILGGF